MESNQAESLSNRVIQRTDFSATPESERARLVTRDALQWAAETHFPDKAPFAVVSGNDDSPIAVALSGTTVQILEPLLPETEMSPGRVRWRALGVVAGRDQIQAEVTYRRNSTQHQRLTRWEFRGPDLRFNLETIVDETEPAQNSDERFAQTLAAALGAKIPQPARTVRLRAL